MSNPKPKLEIKCRGDFVWRLAISPCGSRNAACDGGINFYDVESNKQVGQLPGLAANSTRDWGANPGPHVQAMCLMYSPDGTLIVVGPGGTRSKILDVPLGNVANSPLCPTDARDAKGNAFCAHHMARRFKKKRPGNSVRLFFGASADATSAR